MELRADWIYSRKSLDFLRPGFFKFAYRWVPPRRAPRLQGFGPGVKKSGSRQFIFTPWSFYWSRCTFSSPHVLRPGNNYILTGGQGLYCPVEGFLKPLLGSCSSARVEEYGNSPTMFSPSRSSWFKKLCILRRQVGCRLRAASPTRVLLSWDMRDASHCLEYKYYYVKGEC